MYTSTFLAFCLLHLLFFFGFFFCFSFGLVLFFFFHKSIGLLTTVFYLCNVHSISFTVCCHDQYRSLLATQILFFVVVVVVLLLLLLLLLGSQSPFFTSIVFAQQHSALRAWTTDIFLRVSQLAQLLFSSSRLLISVVPPPHTLTQNIHSVVTFRFRNSFFFWLSFFLFIVILTFLFSPSLKCFTSFWFYVVAFSSLFIAFSSHTISSCGHLNFGYIYIYIYI